MLLLSRYFLWTPRRALAHAALLAAVVVGCRAVPGETEFSRRAPVEDGRKDRATATSSVASAEVSDPLLRAEFLRRRDRGAAERTAALTRGLEDDDPLVRGVAVLSLLAEPPDAATRTAIAGAPAPSLEARFLRAEWARRSGQEHARAAGATTPPTSPACAWARAETDPAIRSRAAAGCALLAAADESDLLSLARDPEWQVRARLATAFAGRRGAASAAAVLNLLAHDPHPTVRRAALSVGPAPS